MSEITGRGRRQELGSFLLGKLEQRRNDRRIVETRWLQDYNQYKGIYDNASTMEEECSKAYPRLTRVKVESFVSRVMHMLFPKTERNWTLKSSRTVDLSLSAVESALSEYMEQTGGQYDPAQFDQFMTQRNEQATAELERLVVDQMADMGVSAATTYESLVRKVVRSAVVYALGVLRGPLTESYEVGTIQTDQLGMPEVVAERRFRPYFEFVPCKNYFPDLSAPSFDEMEGAFVYEPISKADVQDLAKDDSYDKDSVEWVLRAMPDGDYKSPQIETEFESARGDNNRTKKGKRYGLVSYWGWISGKRLKNLLVENVDRNGEPIEDEQRYRVFVEVLGGMAIKVAIDPFEPETQAFHHFVFEDDDAGLIGESLPSIVRESQLVIANAARMLVDNAGSSSGPMAEVDINLIDVARMGGNLSMRPRKTFLKDSLNNPGNTGRAVQPIQFDSHVNELLGIISSFKSLADEETFVGPATGGDFANMPSEALRTTSNASMILGNSALPFKEVVSNFDRFTVSVLTALINWNRLFNSDLVGAADARPEARGATSLMAKELRAFAIDNIGQTLTEDERDFLNPEALLRERLKVRDLDFEGLLEDPQVAQEKRQRRQENEQAMAQLQQRILEQEIKKLEGERLKDISQAQKNLDNAEATVIKTLVEAMEKGANVDELFQILLRGRGQNGQTAGVEGQASGIAGGTQAATDGVAGAGANPLGGVGG